MFDVSNDSCLLLTSHVNVLALIFADNAFAVSDLKHSKHLYRLDLESRQLFVLIKSEMNDVYLFRCSELDETQVSVNEKLTYDFIRKQLLNLKKIADIDSSTNAYIFRRENVEALDTNSTYEDKA